MWSKWMINQLHIKYHLMHCFLEKKAKPERWDMNMCLSRCCVLWRFLRFCWKTANVTSWHSVTDETFLFLIWDLILIVIILVKIFIFSVEKFPFIILLGFALSFIHGRCFIIIKKALFPSIMICTQIFQRFLSLHPQSYMFISYNCSRIMCIHSHNFCDNKQTQRILISTANMQQRFSASR